jgi:hypothetical protein
MIDLEERMRSIASRRAWAKNKFGKCRGTPEGCEPGITREDLRPLKVTWYIPGLGRTTSLDIFCASSINEKKEDKPQKERKSRIKCRHCSGCHLTAKCPARLGSIAPLSVKQEEDKPRPQTYYLGPPPGIESNPLDFELFDSQEHRLEPEEILKAVQNFSKRNQPVHEVKKFLNKILYNNQPQYTSRAHHQSTALPRVNPLVANRKWINSRRCIEYTKDDRWDFRNRKTPTPTHSGV